MGTLSVAHWLIVGLVILLLFGPSRLSGLGKGLGDGIKSFRKGLSDDPPEGEAANSDAKDNGAKQQLGSKIKDSKSTRRDARRRRLS